MQDAINKLQTEMDANKSNTYIWVVGTYLLKYLEQQPEAAEKFMTKDKTIAKSLAVMKAEAQKVAVSGCGVLTDQQGFDIVLKYFGIEAAAVPPAEQAPVPEKKSAAFDIDLDDLLK